jgi:hypothetical protein
MDISDDFGYVPVGGQYIYQMDIKIYRLINMHKRMKKYSTQWYV